MGLLDGFKRIKDPIRGSAQIVSSTQAPQGATSGNCRMHLVVSVPGHQAFAVDDSFLIRVKKWPHAGQTLPIEASRSNPTKFKILWDEIPTWRDTASSQAAQIAAAMNQQPPPGEAGPQYPPYTPQQGTPVVMINGRPASPEELKQYEAMTGMDLDGDGRIAGGGAAPGGGLVGGLIANAMGGMQPPPPEGAAAGSPGAVDDRVAALERLAALKASGVITETEFETEKARILDS